MESKIACKRSVHTKLITNRHNYPCFTRVAIPFQCQYAESDIATVHPNAAAEGLGDSGVCTNGSLIIHPERQHMEPNAHSKHVVPHQLCSVALQPHSSFIGTSLFQIDVVRGPDILQSTFKS